jgi:hypothetical protein
MLRQAALVLLITLIVVGGGAYLLAWYTDVMTGPAVTGTVVDERGVGRKRFLTIADRSGTRHTSRVRVWIHRACPVGAPWPACRDHAR